MVLDSRALRTPEHIRTEAGLKLLIAISILGAIMRPIDVFAHPNFFTPLFTYDIDRAISLLSLTLSAVGAALVVIGRKPFGQKHSERTVLGFALWIAATLYGLFVAPQVFLWLAPLLPGTGAIAVVSVNAMVETAILLLGSVLLVYHLESLNGRRLLWMASIVGLGVAVAFDSQNLRLFPYYPDIVQRTVLSLSAVTSALFAAAFLIARSRVRNDLHLSNQL